MKTGGLLRATAIPSLVQGLAHGLMHVRYTPVHGPAEVALVATMKARHFSFGGFERSYWEFYFGYGLFVAFGCMVQAILLWLLATLASAGPARIKPLIALLVLANLGYGLLVLKFFFLLPALFDFAIAGGLAVAFAIAGPKRDDAESGSGSSAAQSPA